MCQEELIQRDARYSPLSIPSAPSLMAARKLASLRVLEAPARHQHGVSGCVLVCGVSSSLNVECHLNVEWWNVNNHGTRSQNTSRARRSSDDGSRPLSRILGEEGGRAAVAPAFDVLGFAEGGWSGVGRLEHGVVGIKYKREKERNDKRRMDDVEALSSDPGGNRPTVASCPLGRPVTWILHPVQLPLPLPLPRRPPTRRGIPWLWHGAKAALYMHTRHASARPHLEPMTIVYAFQQAL
jgi:hypothetical protein